jgi:predicted site-specific integrase-resolvase
VFAIFEAKKGALVIIDEGEDSRFEEELSGDVLALLTLFLSRLYAVAPNNAGNRLMVCVPR